VQARDERTPFFIVALPRSGTAWLANFLTFGDAFCFHEGLFCCDSLDRHDEVLRGVDQSVVGNADTGAIYVLPALYKRYPGAKYVFVIRDPEEVAISLHNIGLTPTSVPAMIDYLWWGVTYVKGALIVKYDDLFNQITLRKIWAHVGMPDPFPSRRTELLRQMRVEDGICSGFGRFADPELLEEGKVKFNALMKSVRNEQVDPDERRLQ
jgi:hypothetical protein